MVGQPQLQGTMAQSNSHDPHPHLNPQPQHLPQQQQQQQQYHHHQQQQLLHPQSHPHNQHLPQQLFQQIQQQQCPGPGCSGTLLPVPPVFMGSALQQPQLPLAVQSQPHHSQQQQQQYHYQQQHQKLQHEPQVTHQCTQHVHACSAHPHVIVQQPSPLLMSLNNGNFCGGLQCLPATQPNTSGGGLQCLPATQSNLTEVLLWDDPCGFCKEKEVLEPVITPCGHVCCRDCFVDALWCECDPLNCRCPGRPCPVCRTLVKQHELALLIPATQARTWKVLTRRCACGERWARYGDPNHNNGPIWCARCKDRPRGSQNKIVGLCECGRAPPTWGLPQDLPWAASWCADCPTRPRAAVEVRGKCDCGAALPRYGLQGGEARWCQDCPSRARMAVDLVSLACACGAGRPTHGHIDQPSSQARWCTVCAAGQQGSLVVDLTAPRCECKRNKPKFDDAQGRLSGRMPRWCELCPGRPAETMDDQGNSFECIYCHDSSHTVLDCSKLVVDRQQECSYCHDEGHYILDCNKLYHDKRVRTEPCNTDAESAMEQAEASLVPSRINPDCASSDHAVLAPQVPQGTTSESREEAAAQALTLVGQTPQALCSPATTSAGAAIRSCECGKGSATLGLPGATRAQAKWCQDCPGKPQQAIDVINRKCICGRSRPSFGLQGEDKKMARWCAKCPTKPPEAVDIISKRCECGRTQPTFGLPGQPRSAAAWCTMCPNRPPEAVDVKNRKCECGKALPNFGMPGEDRSMARWCSQCPTKPQTAVDVRNRRCECGRSQASLGLKGEERTGARWCSKCPGKPPGAVNVTHRKCECGAAQPTLAPPGSVSAKNARWCPLCPGKPSQVVCVAKRKSPTAA